MSDTQINSVVEQYYNDKSLCRSDNESINLWRLYNCFTGANKPSYINTFADRAVSAHGFTNQIVVALDGMSDFWYLN